MKGHGQFCPVAVAADVFAHRWTPLILRELFAGSTHFNEIRRCLPLISRTTLAQRLRALERAGVIRVVNAGSRAQEYQLTEAGAEFKPVIAGLGAWGQRWTTRVDPDHLDAEVLMWNIRRRLDPQRLPSTRTVVQFAFRALPPGYRRARVFWLIIDGGAGELCLQDPGVDVDLLVQADLGDFVKVWLGDLSMSDALRRRSIQLSGARRMVQQFPTWLLLSHFAKVPRPAPAR